MDFASEFMAQPPRRLKKDAILEALYEVRFESADLPELVIGRLADAGPWKEFAKKRLPVSDIPAPIRMSDAGLKNQPVLELRTDDPKTVVKVGSNVFSYHNLSPYRHWENFSKEIETSLKILFESLDNFRAVRLGLRYLNAITADVFKISGFNDLTTSIHILDEKLQQKVNLNYSVDRDSFHTVNARIASPEFVGGPKIQNMTIFIDVDVSTPSNFETSDVDVAIEWMNKAHYYEKLEFFRLIPQHTIDQLAEEE
jgi:uncharacterized protein (TIGR04255 family)